MFFGRGCEERRGEKSVERKKNVGEEKERKDDIEGGEVVVEVMVVTVMMTMMMIVTVAVEVVVEAVVEVVVETVIEAIVEVITEVVAEAREDQDVAEEERMVMTMTLMKTTVTTLTIHQIMIQMTTTQMIHTMTRTILTLIHQMTPTNTSLTKMQKRLSSSRLMRMNLTSMMRLRLRRLAVIRCVTNSAQEERRKRRFSDAVETDLLQRGDVLKETETTSWNLP